MPQDPAVDQPSSRPWPPPFPAAQVDDARALLADKAVLVIVGPAGGTRDRLAAAIADLLEGPARTRHVARHGERDQPWFVVSQLFRNAPPAGHADRAAVEAAVRAELVAIDDPPPIVLANADLADLESLDLLVTLAASGTVRVIATLSTGAVATGGTTDVERRLMDAAAVVEAPALDLLAISHVLGERFGVPPRSEVAELVLSRSSGSYPLVRELADAALTAGSIVVADDHLALADGRASGLLPLATDDPGGEQVADLIDLTAVLGRLDAEEARAAVGGAAVDLARRGERLEEIEGMLVFTLPAERTLTLRTSNRARLVELFERYAALVPRTIAAHGVAVPAADWWRAAGRLLPIDLAARAARHANLLGHHRRALAYSDVHQNDEQRSVAPMERGFALNELGHDTELQALVADLDPRRLTEDELLPWFMSVRLLQSTADHDRLVVQAVASDDPAVRRRREAVRTLSELVELTYTTGAEKIATRLRALAFSAQLSPANRATTFATLAAVMRHAGRPSQAVDAAEFALEILRAERDDVSAFHLDLAREVHILALTSLGDVAGAEAALRAYATGIYVSANSGRMTAALQTTVAMIRGDLSGALASARTCLSGLGDHDPHQLRGLIEALAAQALVRSGRPGEARDALDAARRHSAMLPERDLTRRVAIAVALDALAEPEEALGILAEVGQEARRRGLRLAQISAAGTAVTIGGPPLLPALLEATDDLVDASGTSLLWQVFAIAAHDYDFPALIDLADHLHRIGVGLLSAEVAQFVLDLARRASDLDPATRERLGALANLSRHPR